MNDAPGERWAPIPGFPAYELSNYGRLRKYFTGHFTGPNRSRRHILSLANGDGYYYRPTVRDAVEAVFGQDHFYIEPDPPAATN